MGRKSASNRQPAAVRRRTGKGRVMVFGVFDGLHPGHRHFLAQAKKMGGFLIAVVARDAAVAELKGRRPRAVERARAAELRRSGLADKVVLGDAVPGRYAALKRYPPDVIALGYDQDGLAADLRGRMRRSELPQLELARLRAYRPRSFHSSIFRSLHDGNLAKGAKRARVMKNARP